MTCNDCALTEAWTPIPDQADYEISDHGRVRSLKRGTPYMLKPQANALRGGYLHVGTSQGVGHQYTLKVHVQVALAFLGPRPDGLVIRHLDGNATNNHLDNLAYGTFLENSADQRKHGTHNNGRKTHCLRGHEFNEDNTRVTDGTRYCRACSRISYARNAEANVRRAREYRERKRREAEAA